jgi:hypothetical protein
VSRLAIAVAGAAASVIAGVATLMITAANSLDVVFAVITLVATVPYVAVGFLIAWRRPANPIGWLMLALPLCFQTSILIGQYAIMAVRIDAPLGAAATWLSYWLWVPGWLALGLVFLLFPDGRLPSERWRPVLRGVVVADAVAILCSMLGNDPRQTQTGLANPMALVVQFPLYDVAIAFLLIVFAVPALSLFARYRRANGQVRRKLKWLAYGGSLLVASSVAYLLVLRTAEDATTTDLGDLLFVCGVAAPAVAIGIAILRDRVFDIDVLIRRTLVYGAVSAILVASYAAGVILLQSFLRPLTAGSDLAVAASTLLVVALFHPLRARVQDLIDRRFFRSRYDAARTLDTFTTRMRDQVDIDAVRVDVLDVVGTTLQPAHASVWLRNREG